MLPKAHLTSHSRMSGVITPSWLSGSLRSFLYSSVYSFHLFLISSASKVHSASVFYHAHLCKKYSLVSLIFLKRSLVFPIILFSSISLHCSHMKASYLFSCSLEPRIQEGVSFLFSFAFCFSFSSVICKASSDNHFAFLFPVGDGFYHWLLYNVTHLCP